MVFLIDESGSNLLIGTAETDELFGLAGADSISGLGGSDLLFGNQDSDTISGDQGDDIIYAGRDNDLIFGGQGSDRLFGDAGNDTVYGDKGADILIGGLGSDVFVIDQGTGGSRLEEANIIPDFIVGEDIVKLGENLDVNQLSFEAIDSGNSTLIRNQDTGEYLLILQDVNILALTPESFDPQPEEIVPLPTGNIDPELEPLPEPGTPPDIDVLPPSIEASLANDTGVDNSDGITSDITITGRATDDRGTPELEVSLGGEFVPISTAIAADGSFTLNQAQLEQAFGSPFADGDYTVFLRSVDASGLVSPEFASVVFTLDTSSAPPDDGNDDDDNNDVTPIELPEDIEDTPIEEIEIEIPQIEVRETREVDEEPGNTAADAYSLALSSNTLVYSEQLSATDTDDYYVFTVGADNSITISLDGLSQSADLFLLDSNETVIASSQNLGITDELIARPLEFGTYYIRVQSVDSQATDYNLNLSVTPRVSGITSTGSEDEVQTFTNQSSSLINLEPSSSSDTEAFRSDSRFTGIDGTGYATVIIDTGIDLDHPFFGPDNDGDGIADRIVFQYDFAEGDGDASDFRGHGSNVSSIVASEDSTFTGMAPGADIIHLKVFPDQEGGAPQYAVEQALNWVATNAEEYNIVSVNLSLGSGNFSQPTIQEDRGYYDELAALVDQGIIVVSAAGNDFFDVNSEPGVAYPAADPNSLAVGAVLDSDFGSYPFVSGGSLIIDRPDGEPISRPIPPDLDLFNAVNYTTGADEIAAFSQRHPELTDIFAPGAYITGAGIVSDDIYTTAGTSMAAPHIAGIAVLAQQLAEQELGRTLTFDEFRDLLQSTGVTIFDEETDADNVVNTNAEYTRVDVLALAEGILELGGSPEPTPEPEPEPTELTRYEFIYLYDGSGIGQDHYVGYVDAAPGTYNIGERYDAVSFDNEEGFNGLYYIQDATAAPSDAVEGEVYVRRYIDVGNETQNFVPYYFDQGEASGFNGLGTEYDFVVSEDGTPDDFGRDFAAVQSQRQILDGSRFTTDEYSANDRPRGVIAADLDGDGDNELITANSGFDAGVEGRYEGNQISILDNNGDGTFADPVTLTTGVGPSVIAGDFDNDGHIDLITAHAEDDDISVFFNDGEGNFDESDSETYNAGDRPFVADVADVDGDGDQDLITVNTEGLNLSTAITFGDSISIHFNDGDGGFRRRTTEVVGDGVDDVVAADLDDDGDIDLATTNDGEDTVSVLLNRGDGSFRFPEKFDVGVRPVSLVAEDLDGDGDLDLAVTNFGRLGESESLSILFNNGNASFNSAEFFNTEDRPSTLTAGDIDGDGDIDLMMLNSFFIVGTGEREGSTTSLLENNGDGTFSNPEIFQVGEVPSGLVIDNLDNSGGLDFATVNFDSDDATVYLQSEGQLPEPTPTPTPTPDPEPEPTPTPTPDPEPEFSGTLTFVDSGVDGVEGISSTSNPVISPDGAFVYLNSQPNPSEERDGVMVLSRDETTGELSFVEQTILDEEITEVDISPDGEHLYISFSEGDGIGVYERDVQTGELTQVEIEVNSDLSDLASTIVVSPDGANVYRAYDLDRGLPVLAGIATYERDPQTGELTLSDTQALIDFDGFADAFELPSIDGLLLNNIAISPDGESVYVKFLVDTDSGIPDALVVLSRDTTTGELSYVDTYKEDFVNLDNMLSNLVVSPDNEFVYLSGRDDNGDTTVSVLSQDSTTKELTWVETFSFDVENSFNREMTISPDGEFIYIPGEDDVIVARRDQVTGELTEVEIESSPSTTRFSDLTISPDGRHIYATSLEDDVVVSVFSRDEA